MKFLYGLGGANVPIIKNFELSNINLSIEAGCVVKCNADGKVTTNSSDAILGVSAEKHSNKKDILNARDGGDRIRVDITKYGVYRADAPRFVATKTGTATTVYGKGNDDLSSNMNGAFLVLIEKGENSMNTDKIGTARKISSYGSEGSYVVITASSGSTSYEGDVYAIIPSIGNEHPISDNNTTISYGVGSGGKMKVVGHNLEKGTIDVVLKDTIFD